VVRFTFTARKRLLILVCATLIGYGAAGFAGALTRTLALAATAVGKRLAQTRFGNGLDMFHKKSLH
jgi:hypothetical protein